jgi:diguanylate cyclase (GGDEF)-like protein
VTASLEGRIRFLTSVTEGMLSSFDLDEIIYVILSGITSGEGMGFHRAFLFLLLRALRFPRHGGLRLTVSAGIACTSSAGRSPRGLVEAADRALYRAKRLGRNRIETNG